MATEERHITRQEKTEALFRTNGDHGQSAILTDQNEEWVYYNDDKSLLYYAAAQKTWDGAAWAYVNNDFGQVTLHDDLLVDEYIKRSGGTDDRIRFENDKITIAAGGVDAIVFEDDRIYSDLKKFGLGKTTLEDWITSTTALQVAGLGSLSGQAAEGASNEFTMANNWYRNTSAEECRMYNDEVTKYIQEDGNHRWYADAAAAPDADFTPTERMRLSSSDFSTTQSTLSIGKSTIEAWPAVFDALQVGGMSNIIGTHTEGAGGSCMIMQNAYTDAANKRIVNDEASILTFTNGNMLYYSINADTPDVAFTPINRLFLTAYDHAEASARLGLGTTTPASVNGAVNAKMMKIEVDDGHAMVIHSLNDNMTTDVNMLEISDTHTTFNDGAADIDWAVKDNTNTEALKVVGSDGGIIMGNLLNAETANFVYYNTTTKELSYFSPS
jgi:hypothetical protein